MFRLTKHRDTLYIRSSRLGNIIYLIIGSLENPNLPNPIFSRIFEKLTRCGCVWCEHPVLTVELRPEQQQSTAATSAPQTGADPPPPPTFISSLSFLGIINLLRQSCWFYRTPITFLYQYHWCCPVREEEEMGEIQSENKFRKSKCKLQIVW